MGDDDAAAEEHEVASVVESVVEDREHDADTDQSEATTISLGRGIFLVGVCSAIGWLAGYTTIVYWDIDPWLVGPALALFLGGGAGLVITMLTTSSSSDAEDTHDD